MKNWWVLQRFIINLATWILMDPVDPIGSQDPEGSVFPPLEKPLYMRRCVICLLNFLRYVTERATKWKEGTKMRYGTVRLCFCILNSSVSKENWCEWDWSKNGQDLMNARSPDVINTWTHRQRKLLVSTSYMGVTWSYWMTWIKVLSWRFFKTKAFGC